MPRKLIICFDGTSNEFGKENTNVVRLIQVLDRNPDEQRLYYDPGVGTLPEPGFATWIGGKFSDLLGLAFGAGLTWKVQEAYCYLMDMWEPGDQVFVFGFSRGAYTARVFAGLLHAFGLLPRGNQNLVPYVMRLYASARDERKNLNGGFGRWQQLCDDFRWSFARQMFSGDDERRFPVYFIGAWDTVSSVGWIWNPDSFPYTACNPSVQFVRHAVSIDERRWFFRQNLLKPAQGQDFKEYWFAGVHSEIGGGYPELYSDNPAVYSGVWRNAFEWMVKEATQKGLLIDAGRYQRILSRTPPCSLPWTEELHESLVFPWWFAEIIPKRVWDSKLQKLKWAVGLGQHRTILTGALIEKTVLQRIQQTNYGPPNLSPAFISQVKGLPDLPDAFPYS